MKALQKTFVALVAGVSFIAAASSASAQTLTPGQAIKATGTLNQSLALDPASTLTICSVTFHGVVLGSGTTVTGFQFNSYEGTQVGGPGNLACDDSIQFGPVSGGPDDLTLNFTSPTQLNLAHILISTRLGDCEDTNIALTWNGSGVTFPVGTNIAPVCQFDGTLTVSPE
jgi:hypothetical protein